jgi:transketolase
MLPHMHVVCPGDAVEVRLALRSAVELGEPVYMRLGKKGEPVVHQQRPDFVIGKAIDICPGHDVCLLSTGNTLPIAVQASGELTKNGVSTRVVSFHTVKPLDVECLREVFADFKVVATIEEHSILGGLGGSIAEWLADEPPQNARLLRIGTADRFLHEAGDQAYARDCFGLTPEAIAEKTLCVVRNM